MEDLTSLIRYLIGASRIKYEVLENLYATIPTMQYRMGVMYVDAHSIFYRLFREKDFSTVYADSMNELVRDLVVGFFNVIGHYRRFMATRLQLDNDIYVMFNPDLPKWHEHYTDRMGGVMTSTNGTIRNTRITGFMRKPFVKHTHSLLGCPHTLKVYTVSTAPGSTSLL